ncbi:MAG: phosphoribosylformylglycinamidine cyclo-ligase [Chloroflexi bacterium]|nr:phosphoribosylformylglycinamidine cyclo-ligase [Chloroflexota bacterium]
MTRLTYKDAGVDTALKAETLARLRARVKPGRPEVIGGIGGFGGLFRAPTGKDLVLVATTDGVGTKTEIARLLDRHDVIGTDVVHQSVNDAAATGAEPLFFLDYFATSKLEPGIFERIVDAIAAACEAHGCALLGGETAEMPGTYAAGAYDVVGFLVGAVERDRLLCPANAREGDACIGLPSNGLHTNGYTLARAAIAREAEARGIEPREVLRASRPELRGGSLGDALLEPHRSYLEDVRVLRGTAQVRSIAHLTGGGWEGNLPRALPDGLGAAIDRSTWVVPPVFRILGTMGNVPNGDQWDTWNMGIGLIAIVAREDERAALRALPDAIAIGHVERAVGDRRIRARSRAHGRHPHGPVPGDQRHACSGAGRDGPGAARRRGAARGARGLRPRPGGRLL